MHAQEKRIRKNFANSKRIFVAFIGNETATQKSIKVLRRRDRLHQNDTSMNVYEYLTCHLTHTSLSEVRVP